MKMNLFGYTYKIYDIGYKTEMMSKECNAGDPLETPGGLYRGPPFLRWVGGVLFLVTI